MLERYDINDNLPTNNKLWKALIVQSFFFCVRSIKTGRKSSLNYKKATMRSPCHLFFFNLWIIVLLDSLANQFAGYPVSFLFDCY